MAEVGARAALVPAPDVGEGLQTSVSREEVKQALEDESTPLELILDLTRFSDGEATETRSVAIAWERNDLEELLRETEDDQVVLTFDRATLEEAMDLDVEAHGFREKVLVLAVAATAAGGAAASAAAEPGPYFGAGSPTVQQTLGPDDRAVSRATPAPEATLGVDDRAVSRATPAPEPTLGADDRAISRATPAPEPTLGVDDRAVSRATPAPEATLGADDRAVSRATPAPEPTLGVDDRAVVRATPTPEPIATVDDRNLPRGTSDFVTSEPGVAGDTGDSWAPGPAGTAAIGGAIALAITGAAFLATTRRRRPDVRPA